MRTTIIRWGRELSTLVLLLTTATTVGVGAAVCMFGQTEGVYQSTDGTDLHRRVLIVRCDACYDRGITFRLKWFLNDVAPRYGSTLLWLHLNPKSSEI